MRRERRRRRGICLVRWLGFCSCSVAGLGGGGVMIIFNSIFYLFMDLVLLLLLLRFLCIHFCHFFCECVLVCLSIP